MNQMWRIEIGRRWKQNQSKKKKIFYIFYLFKCDHYFRSLHWAYECVDSQCVRTEITAENHDRLFGLPACHLQCEEYATLLPRPTGDMRLSRSLVSVNTSLITFEFPTSTNQADFWENNQKRFFEILESKNEDPTEVSPPGGLYGLSIQIITSSDDLRLDLDTDESYTLKMAEKTNADNSRNLQVTISAATYFGARHGLETIAQLIVYDELRHEYLTPAEVEIVDAPVYKYRGLLIDTVRQYHSIAAIKRTIDTMALVKLNVFHWHITDSQSFPMELDTFPELARIGAYHPKKVYTTNAIREVVQFGLQRGVRVLPELDFPAHVAEGWQETGLMVCYNEQPWNKFCAGPPCGQLDITNENLYPVLWAMYEDVNRAFAVTDLFHMGGDEVYNSCWNVSESIQQHILDRGLDLDSGVTFTGLWAEFQERVKDQYKAINDKARIILWTNTLTEEPVVENYLKKEDYVIQVWTSGTGADSHVPHLLEKGYDLIMSNYDAFYFDCGFGSWVGTGNNWCSPYKAWHQVYNNNLRAMAGDKVGQVLGGEGCLWASISAEQTLDSRLWPRASALAERLWTEPEENFRHVEKRILLHRHLLTLYGVQAESIQPDWCLMHDGECPLG